MDQRGAEPEAKAQLTARSHTALQAFLDAGSRLTLAEAAEPRVSAILVLYNRAELTLRCLRSLAETVVPLEVVIVDNASSDQTPALLRQVDGVRVVRNGDNRGFLRAVNQAARRCRGRHLLLLNNDAELLPGSLEAALEALEAAPDVGAVGARLLLPDGSLQEAGSIVWSDGSCLGYGRGEPPDRPEFMFRRDVDYCSGAFLLTPRALFEELGGFDEDYAPAYYEEADYCLRLWASGRRVVYEPRATVLHYEFASSQSMSHAVRMQAERRAIFVRKHAAALVHQQPPALDHALRARTRRRGPAARVLVLDDRVPHDALGAGFPRARRLLRTLVELGHETTVFPLSAPEESWADVYADLPRTLEVVKHLGVAGLGPFLAARRGHYDVVLVSRPHNMLRLRAALASEPTALAGAALVYDAEALFARREVARRRLRGEEVPAAEEAALVRQEAELAASADVVLAVSEAERTAFVAAGSADVRVLGHALDVGTDTPAFAVREGLLFVGAVHGDDDPNADSLTWLARELLPALHARCGRALPLRVAGTLRSSRVARLAGPHVQFLGAVADLSELYDTSRIFVAPTRFGAGIPHKVHEAAAHGLPVVATSLLAGQLGWTAGHELLVADDAPAFAEACSRLEAEPALWEAVRTAAVVRLQRDASPATFAATIRDSLAAALEKRRARDGGRGR